MLNRWRALKCFFGFHKWSDPWWVREYDFPFRRPHYGRDDNKWRRSCVRCMATQISYGYKKYWGKKEYTWMEE